MSTLIDIKGFAIYRFEHYNNSLSGEITLILLIYIVGRHVLNKKTNKFASNFKSCCLLVYNQVFALFYKIGQTFLI